jgi:hypothetical protein
MNCKNIMYHKSILISCIIPAADKHICVVSFKDNFVHLQTKNYSAPSKKFTSVSDCELYMNCYRKT